MRTYPRAVLKKLEAVKSSLQDAGQSMNSTTPQTDNRSKYRSEPPCAAIIASRQIRHGHGRFEYLCTRKFNRALLPSSSRMKKTLTRNATVAALLVWIFYLPGEPLLFASPEGRPNVVVILADDLGWNDVSLHGGKTPTPNLDNLAKCGVEFTNFIVNSVCSPTRAAFLTGMNAVRNGFGAEVGDCLNPEFRTIAQSFRDSGYRTGLFGKWHNGKPDGKSRASMTPWRAGFEYFQGFFGGGTDYYNQLPKESRPGAPSRRNWYLNSEHVAEGEGYTTDLITDATVNFIEANQKNPFFCVVAHAAPHDPFQATDALLKRVPESLRAGTSLTEESVRAKSRDPNKKTDFQTGEFGGFTEHEREVVYSAMLIGLDDGVRKIINSIKTNGLEKNTIVLFFSDNGAMRFIREGNLPFRNWKHELYEGGIHVPGFLVVPGGKIIAGSKFEPVIRAEDLFPTLASMANVTIGNHRPLDGVNMAPALEGKEKAAEVDWNGIFVNYGAHRTSDWKLIIRAKSKELYNIRIDLSESKDVSLEFPDIVKKLHAKHMAWLKEVGANVNYSPAEKNTVSEPNPEGEVLNVVLPVSADKKKQFFDFEKLTTKSTGLPSEDLQADPGDCLVYDICQESMPANTSAYVSPIREDATVFGVNAGIDSNGMLVAARSSSNSELGKWTRHVVGIGNLAAMSHSRVRFVIEAPTHRRQEVSVLLDNIHILKKTGLKIRIWSGGDPPRAVKSDIIVSKKSI